MKVWQGKEDSMSRLVRPGIAVLALLCMVGCMQVDSLVKIKPDGSGTIEETVLMSREFIKQMEAMTSQMGAKQGEGASKGFNVFDQEEVKKKAGAMGEGVAYVSSKKVTVGDKEGYRVCYAFTDINKVKLNQNPGDKVPSSGPGNKEKKGEFIRFQFTRGNPATLIVRMPARKPGDKPEFSQKPKPEQGQDADMAMGMMSQMLKGMKITVAVEVEGAIVETNATHRQGSRITLMEMEFDKLIENQEKFKEFARSKPESLEEAKKIMKDLPGIKVEFNEEVRIRFR